MTNREAMLEKLAELGAEKSKYVDRHHARGQAGGLRMTATAPAVVEVRRPSGLSLETPQGGEQPYPTPYSARRVSRLGPGGPRTSTGGGDR